MNNISLEGVEVLSLALKYLKKLTSLDLQLNSLKIEKQGVEYLSSTLIELKKLVSLNLGLSYNFIKD